jgi:transposase
MSLGRARQTLILTPEEKQKLELIAGRPKTSQSQALRARIVLACAGEGTHQSIARTLGTTPATVGKWRNRFVKNRLQALGDAPRSGPPRSVSDVEVGQIHHPHLGTQTQERHALEHTHDGQGIGVES